MLAALEEQKKPVTISRYGRRCGSSSGISGISTASISSSSSVGGVRGRSKESPLAVKAKPGLTEKLAEAAARSWQCEKVRDRVFRVTPRSKEGRAGVGGWKRSREDVATSGQARVRARVVSNKKACGGHSKIKGASILGAASVFVSEYKGIQQDDTSMQTAVSTRMNTVAHGEQSQVHDVGMEVDEAYEENAIGAVTVSSTLSEEHSAQSECKPQHQDPCWQNTMRHVLEPATHDDNIRFSSDMLYSNPTEQEATEESAPTTRLDLEDEQPHDQKQEIANYFFSTESQQHSIVHDVLPSRSSENA